MPPTKKNATCDSPLVVEAVPSAVEGNYLVLTLQTVGVNISRQAGKQGGESRTIWASHAPPAGKEVKLAVPLIPGAGPAPEETICLQDFQDLMVVIATEVEHALDTLEKNRYTRQGEW